jgi:hypothetical protein
MESSCRHQGFAGSHFHANMRPVGGRLMIFSRAKTQRIIICQTVGAQYVKIREDFTMHMNYIVSSKLDRYLKTQIFL